MQTKMTESSSESTEKSGWIGNMAPEFQNMIGELRNFWKVCCSSTMRSSNNIWTVLKQNI